MKLYAAQLMSGDWAILQGEYLGQTTPIFGTECLHEFAKSVEELFQSDSPYNIGYITRGRQFTLHTYTLVEEI